MDSVYRDPPEGQAYSSTGIELLLNHVASSYGLSLEANNALDGKLATILGAGSITFAVLGVATAAGLLGPVRAVGVLGGLGIVIGAYALMVGLALWGWRPADFLVPMVWDADEVWAMLGQDLDSSRMNWVWMILDSQKAALEANARKARALRWALILLVAQLAVVLGLVAIRVWLLVS